MRWTPFTLGLIAASTGWSQIDQVATDFGLLGMSVTTFCGDSVQQEVHVGIRNVSEGWPVESETKYRMASVSKGVVALACARLVDAGLLAYDEAVDTYLGWELVHPNAPELPVTVSDLLSHRSGLRDGSGYSGFLADTYAAGPDAPNIQELVSAEGDAFTGDMWGTAPPGTYFQYANVNYGVLATAMEAATNMRFDELMDNLVLQPLDISGSFNVGTLPDLGQIATLYRNLGGWTPQADQFTDTPPVAWDWSPYVPGTNGLAFAPQGGLRASTEELARIASVWHDGTHNGTTLLSPTGINALHGATWTFDGSNGNNYYGLFNSWSQGLHRANGTAGDNFFGDGALFIGHAGEAYGLISDVYVEPSTGWGFAFATNGAWDGYSFGASSWYAVEEALHAALVSDRAACAAANSVDPLAFGPRQPLPNPLPAGAQLSTEWHGSRWFGLDGKEVVAGYRAPSMPGHYVALASHGQLLHIIVE